MGTQENPNWWPTLQRVAALLRARTLEKGVSGDYVDTFTANTRPTAAQVMELIGQADAELAGRTNGRGPCTIALQARATEFLAYRAAELVEMSYRPEASQEGTTLAAQLRKKADDRLVALALDITDRCPLPIEEEIHPPIGPVRAVRRGWDGPVQGRRSVW